MTDPDIERCFEGTVQRGEHTPSTVVDTCLTWFGSTKSAMYRFHRGKSVKPRDLIREATQALTESTLGPAEDNRLRQLQVWATRQQTLCRVARDLRDAHAEFLEATKQIELDPFLAEGIRRAALLVPE